MSCRRRQAAMLTSALPAFFVLVLSGFGAGIDVPTVNAATAAIPHPEWYFHTPIGSEWHYEGVLREGDVELIAGSMRFENTSIAVEIKKLDDVDVIVFRETNPGNNGEVESLYRIDSQGVTYYGSRPQSLFEQQLIPYRVVSFPLIPTRTVRQFDVKNVDFHQDLDDDGINERADAVAEVTVGDLETIAVPAGAFRDVLRLDGEMTIHITLSQSGHVVTTKDRLTSWFAPHVGLIKYTEQVDVPILEEFRHRSTWIKEELSTYTLAQSSSGDGS